MTAFLLFKLCQVTLAKAALLAVLVVLACLLAPASAVALFRDWRALQRTPRALPPDTTSPRTPS